METRAHFVLIGTFTISVFVGVFLFVLWLAKVEIDREFAEYDIIFSSNVTGLSRGGDVRYNGIKVGEVTRLSLDPKNPSRVIARVRIDATTPVSEDSKATFEFIGLTGVAYIALAGGGPESKPLKPREGESVPTIVATPSAIQELFAGAPDALTGVNQVIMQVQQILSPDNITHVNNILTNLETVTNAAASRSGDIDSILANSQQISQDLASASAHIRELTEGLADLTVSANALLGDDGHALVEDTREAIRAYGMLAENANNIVTSNSAAIRSFAQDGLGQIGPLVVETRQMMRTLDRVLNRFESDPARYLSGNYAAEYEAD